MQCKYAEIKELQRRLLEKQFMTKFKVLAKKVTFIKKIVVSLKQSMSHKSVHWYQCFSLSKMFNGECLVHDKEKFLF